MQRILITGATGFVGLAVVKKMLSGSDFLPCVAVRQSSQQLPANVQIFQVECLGPDTDWATALQGIDVVVHAAARVHVMEDKATNQLEEFRRVNVGGTLRLACQAAEYGVKRFVFVSSIKVNGEESAIGAPLNAEDQARPVDPYGISKMEAEQGLQQLARTKGIEVVSIRPPLVYGPGVKANFRSMMAMINRGIPLPLGAIHNKRSFIGIDNLVDLIVTCIEHPNAANQTFLVSDGKDVSTTELAQSIGTALGKPIWLIPVPVKYIKLVAGMLGKREVVQRLCGTLQVDISKAKDLLGWVPPVTMTKGLKETADWYLRDFT